MCQLCRFVIGTLIDFHGHFMAIWWQIGGYLMVGSGSNSCHMHGCPAVPGLLNTRATSLGDLSGRHRFANTQIAIPQKNTTEDKFPLGSVDDCKFYTHARVHRTAPAHTHDRHDSLRRTRWASRPPTGLCKHAYTLVVNNK